MAITRRSFIKSASFMGASLAFSRGEAQPSARAWRERRDLYPEGVASGDPNADSVLLWTRRPPINGDRAKQLTVEVAEDEAFARVVATARAQTPLREMYIARRPPASKPEPTINMLVRHGVRSALEYARSGDVQKARTLSNPDLSPHLSFVDLGGHGYATVRVTPQAIESEFVCIPRPVERSAAPDGGPLLYRVSHRARLWKRGERPALEQRVLEGMPALSI